MFIYIVECIHSLLEKAVLIHSLIAHCLVCSVRFCWIAKWTLFVNCASIFNGFLSVCSVYAQIHCVRWIDSFIFPFLVFPMNCSYGSPKFVLLFQYRKQACNISTVYIRLSVSCIFDVIGSCCILIQCNRRLLSTFHSKTSSLPFSVQIFVANSMLCVCVTMVQNASYAVLRYLISLLRVSLDYCSMFSLSGNDFVKYRTNWCLLCPSGNCFKMRNFFVNPTGRNFVLCLLDGYCIQLYDGAGMRSLRDQTFHPVQLLDFTVIRVFVAIPLCIFALSSRDVLIVKAVVFWGWIPSGVANCISSGGLRVRGPHLCLSLIRCISDSCCLSFSL